MCGSGIYSIHLVSVGHHTMNDYSNTRRWDNGGCDRKERKEEGTEGGREEGEEGTEGGREERVECEIHVHC